ncbi:MAG TPA: phenylalanine--tRNA ligase subunit beta [Gemmatimonadota bacterium]|nr:phenylalanine--tRNA ligase subunit beta [Gemmatimonadota bacterium]
MNVSYRWLESLFPEGALAAFDPVRLADRLTMQGLAVDDVRRPFPEISGVVLGRVLEADRHPNADRLTLCRVAAGDGERQVVCGAPNVEVGAIYAYATEGARLPGGREIRRTRIRGVESQGMLCSAPELGLEALGSADGIWPVPGVGEGDLGRDLVDVLDLDDRILDVDVPSNRGDLLSHLGVAREAQWQAGAHARLPARELDEGGPEADVQVVLDDREGCPIYFGRLIRQVAVGPSPAWLQVRLLALGARPVNNVVDATNYTMLECGQPLHPFDAGRLAGRRILVRRPRAGEEIVTLDGRTRSLDAATTVIADGERAVAVGGVMGGLDSEVGAGTTEVFLEAAWFEPARVGRTARGLGLRTDAATRFSRGVDPGVTAPALDRAASLIVALAGGRVARGRVGQGPDSMGRPRIELRAHRLETVIGRPIAEDDARRALESLGFEVRDGGEGVLVAEVPSWRFDVQREIDLIEEVARTTGYDRVPAVRLSAASAPLTTPAERAIAGFRAALSGAGYDEARTPTFVGEAVLGGGYGVDNLVEIRNPISKAERFLRPFVFASLAGAVVHNLNRGASSVRLFEIGHAFRPRRGGGVDESRRVSLAASGPSRPVDWSRPVEPVDFFDVKGTVEDLLLLAAVEDASFVPTTRVFLHPGRQAGVRIGAHEAGLVGEIHPRVAEEWGVEGRIVVAEMDLEILARERQPVQLRGVPREPAVERDLALIVPEDHSSDRVVRAVREAGIEDLVRIQVFDRYRGRQIPAGHVSLGLRLTFQAERTLTVETIEGRIGTLVEVLDREHGYRLR